MALWTGCGPTIGRAMVVNVCQLCCQTQAKEEIAKRTVLKEGYLLSFLGAMIAGFINSCVSLPIDIAKTRLQNMKVMHFICQKGTLVVFSSNVPSQTSGEFFFSKKLLAHSSTSCGLKSRKTSCSLFKGKKRRSC